MIDLKSAIGQRSIFLDVCPHLRLQFVKVPLTWIKLGTTDGYESLVWQNIGEAPIAAWEFVVLRLDTFGEPLQPQTKKRFHVDGSASKTPGGDEATLLEPGTNADDDVSLIFSGFTAVGFITRVRLGNGTVWTCDYLRAGTMLKELDKQVHERLFERPACLLYTSPSPRD